MARKKATQEDQEEIVASDVQEEAESDIKVESIVVPVSQGDINEQQSILQIAKEKLANCSINVISGTLKPFARFCFAL